MTDSTKVLSISLRAQSVAYGDEPHFFHSDSLLRFVAYLGLRRLEDPASWVNLDELRRVLSSTAQPRQLQRFIDSLDKAGLSVVEYKTKTRGPYRIAPKVKNLAFDLDDSALRAHLGLTGLCGIETPDPISLNDFEREVPYFAFINELISSIAFLRDGGTDDAYKKTARFLEQTDAALELELYTSGLLHHALYCQRLERYSEALEHLRKLERLLRDSPVKNVDLYARAQLIMAKVRFDQGMFEDAMVIVEKLDISGIHSAFVLGQYHNLAGMFNHRRLRLKNNALTAKGESLNKDEARQDAEAILRHYYRAMALQLGVNDFQGLQATAYNLGKLLIFCWQVLQLENSEALLKRGIAWLDLGHVVSRDLKVGYDSFWNSITLLELSLSPGIDFEFLKRCAPHLLDGYTNLQSFAEASLTAENKIKNPTEKGELLRIMAQMASADGKVEEAEKWRKMAITVFSEQGKKDRVAEIKALQL